MEQSDKSEIRAGRKARHPLFVRIFHWMNLICFVFLIMSGFQIFNVYPRLHVGNTGNRYEPAIFEVASNSDFKNPRSWIAIGDRRIDTTGFVGQPFQTSFFGVLPVTYPGWMTVPSTPGDMGHARGIHFLFIVPFIANFLIYCLFALLSGHFRREIAPMTRGSFWRELGREIADHARFRNLRAGVAAGNNLLQKITYSVVIFVCFPLMILTGLTMSPAALAKMPWLMDIFFGRQTARTIHFILANALLLFVIVHLAQVIIIGPFASIRAMITGGKARHAGETA